MALLDKVIAQIRFELEQLTVKNAHHEFEHLCRHLTRSRICSNVIPSTGPVSGGGDLSRDFETFRTYLSSSPISDSTFIGLVSDKIIAFACSLQREIASKIRADVNSIMGSESPVEAVNYFCSADIQITKRHYLKKWAEEEYSIDFEIYDGQAVSELLAERDVFWIAERYLSIPAEIYPVYPVKDGNEWYFKLLQEWKQKNDHYYHHADFVEIKSAIRHATFTPEVKQDLPFWIGLMEKIIEQDRPESLKRKSVYETAVASLRGLGTLEGQEDRLREYFNKIPELEEPNEIEDVSILLTYCIGAIFRHLVNLSIKEILDFRVKVIRRTEHLLLTFADKPNLKCRLLEIRGFQSMTLDPVKMNYLDIDDAFNRWIEMTDHVENAPMFPLERFADRLIEFVKITQPIENIIQFDDHPLYDELTQRTDVLLQERYGGFKAAEKCRGRALAFYESGKLIKAINQLHHAKVKWFAEETLKGSLISMLLISKCYSDLGLSFAAKYYALAVAFIAMKSQDDGIKDQIPRALIAAAECDYRKGYWCGFLELSYMGVITHTIYSKDEDASAPYERINRTIFHMVTILVIAEKIAPELAKYVNEIIKKLKMDDTVEDLTPVAREAWQNKDISESWKGFEEQLEGRPFGDIGKIREVIWSEIGVTWTLKWKNEYLATQMAEQFIAFLQIFIADLVGIDLCLLKTDVTINLQVKNINEPLIQPDPSNVGRIWNLALPSAIKNQERKTDRLQADILATASSILSEISLLPSNQFLKILEDCFRRGLSMKAYVAAPYETLFNEFVPKEIFELSEKSSHTIRGPQRKFPIKGHEELKWFSEPGPSYSKEKAGEYLRNRYLRLPIPIKYTLKQLSKNPEFMKTVEKLRAKGWLDWHIIAAVMSITVNYRVNQIQGSRKNIESHKKNFLQAMDEPETEDIPPVSLSKYSEENLRTFSQLNMLSTLTVLNLECRQHTPDFKAIEHFLRHRYNYWIDDIEHKDPFKER